MIERLLGVVPTHSSEDNSKNLLQDFMMFATYIHVLNFDLFSSLDYPLLSHNYFCLSVLYLYDLELEHRKYMNYSFVHLFIRNNIIYSKKVNVIEA